MSTELQWGTRYVAVDPLHFRVEYQINPFMDVAVQPDRELANSVVVGRTVIMPACPDRVRTQLEEWGFTVVIVDVSEFHKGGGSIRCLTNPVDLRVGRDLVSVPGGEVVLP